MSPYDQARALYLISPEVNSFEWYVEHHQRHGFCFATPRFFVMGRHVPSWADHSDITDCSVLFEPERCDTWFIHAMAGDLREVWSILPWPLAQVAFEREVGGVKELRFYPADSIKRLSLPSQ